MRFGDLGRRLAVAAIGIPLVIVLLIVGGWPLTAVIGLIAVLATWELFAMAEPGGTRAFFGIGAAGSLAIVILAGVTRSYRTAAPWALGVVLAVFLLSSTMAIKRRWPGGRPLTAVSLTLLGVILGGGCFSFALFLRYPPQAMGAGLAPPLSGPRLLAFPIAVTWVGDSAAYFVGSMLGRHKLIPPVSPGKTVEGGVAGLLGALLVGAILGWTFLSFHPSTVVSVLVGGAMGTLLGFAAQVGDLAESVNKREAGVKDSGRLLPGHGGILDRFDALMFTLPVTYVLVQLLGYLP